MVVTFFILWLILLQKNVIINYMFNLQFKLKIAVERCGKMIKSMTGYGREQAQIDGRDILVEIRSVNHRYYEFSARTPRAYGYLEEKLKTLLNGKIARGKVEVCVSIFNNEGTDAKIEINNIIAKGYFDALMEANKCLDLVNDLSLSHLIRIPDIFTVKKVLDDEEEIWGVVRSVAEIALQRFISMREVEGKKMLDDIILKLQYIEDMVNVIEMKSPEITEKYREKLYNKLKELLIDNNIDEQRILTETAIFSEKTAVDEETVRLKSHIEQFRTLLNSSEGVGRKLDFLLQEVNREVNTIGSKAQNLEITKMVVDLKSETEKIREQIQNIE